MNERIKQLADEAGLQSFYVDYSPWQVEFEKFAELIVKECAIIANRADNTETEIRCMYDVITEYFGVER
jgi:hypothetical protein